MDLRMEGKRLAASVTTAAGVASVVVVAAGALVLWHQTEQAKSPTTYQQPTDDGQVQGDNQQAQPGFVSPGQVGGSQSQSSGS